MIQGLRHNAPSFVPQSDIFSNATLGRSNKTGQSSYLLDSTTSSETRTSVSDNAYDNPGTIFTQTMPVANYLSSSSPSVRTHDHLTSHVGMRQMEVQYPTFSHRQSMMNGQHLFQPQTLIIPQSQNRFTVPPIYCQNNYHMVEPAKPAQAPIIQESTADDQRILIPSYQDDASTRPASETEEYFPQVYVNFVVTDKVKAKIRVGPDKELMTPEKSGLSAVAKEFIPGTPLNSRFSSPVRSPLNGDAAPFSPNTVQSQDVVYPGVFESPVFFPRLMSEFDESLPYKGAQWDNFPASQQRERIVPPSRYKFTTMNDFPAPNQLNREYHSDMLLAMSPFFTKPTDDIIDLFLQNPSVKGAQKISSSVKENILIRLAVERGELPESFSKESGYHLTPLITPKKRKKAKKKVPVPVKVIETKSRTPSPPPPPPLPLFELERTFEHTIIPSPHDMNTETDSPDKETFTKKFKCILNKVTPENMQVLIEEVRGLGTKWSFEVLEAAVSLIHANVIRNAAFAPVYSEFSGLISDLFPSVELFTELMLELIKKTLNVEGDPALEPKDSIFLSGRMKKVNIVNLMGELFLTDLMEIGEVFEVCRAFAEACSEDIPGFKELSFECLVVLVKICGGKLQEEDEETLGDMMAMLTSMSDDENISKRIRFLLQDVVELNNNEWVSSRSKKEIRPQKIDEIRAEFIATQLPERAGNSPKRRGSPKKFHRNSGRRRLMKTKKKKKKIHNKLRGSPKRSNSTSCVFGGGSPKRSNPSSPIYGGGCTKSKMNYRMAARSAAEKRQSVLKEHILEKVECVVKAMDVGRIKQFAAENQDWRTFLLQRLLRKWRLRPYRKAVKKIIEALHIESIITTSELHEAFRKCGMKEVEFSGGSAVKSPENTGKLARKHSTGFQERSFAEPKPLDVFNEEK